eukprot:jgi/Botrbrau1/18147/Bobra.53_1s0018.1
MVRPSDRSRIPAKQLRLRKACQVGSIKEVDLLLAPEKSIWKTVIEYLLGPWGLRMLGVPENWREGARLEYVYDDDQANLPIHYMAFGSPASIMTRFLAVIGAAGCNGALPTAHGPERAQLLAHLLDRGVFPDLNAINARMETPLHCALRSCSIDIIRVLLTHPLPDGRVVVVTEKDAGDERPLEVAINTQQWAAVRLLVSAGALTKCPEMDDERRELERHMPSGRSSISFFGKSSADLLPWRSILNSVWGSGLINSAAAAVSTPAPPAVPEEAPLATPEAATDGDGFPLVGVRRSRSLECPRTAPKVLQDLEEVKRHREEAVRYVNGWLGRGEDEVFALLVAYNWDEKSLLEDLQWSGRDGGELVMSDASTSQPQAPLRTSWWGRGGNPSVPSVVKCIVCFEDFDPQSLTVQLRCGHVTCDTCWRGILTVRLEDGEVQRLGCPQPGCNVPLPRSLVTQLLDSTQLARFDQLQLQKYVDFNPLIKWCQRPGCGKSIVVDAPNDMARAQQRALTVTCACGYRFCFTCLGTPHEPASCLEAEEWGKVMRAVRQEAANRDQMWMQRNTKSCPGCGSRIQKNGGCNHMACTQCRRHFCWVCGGDWSEHNSATGGYYRCTRHVPGRERNSNAGEGPASPATHGLNYFSELAGELATKLQDMAVHFRLNQCFAAVLRSRGGFSPPVYPPQSG